MNISNKDKVIHRAADRGFFKNEWLESHFSFSFADYFDPNKMCFGALRVINDDVIKGGTGFPTHPHRNMEIITIPLRGSLKHQDSSGGASVISCSEMQLMSAGSGIHHSEFNPSADEPVSLFQIWITPNKVNTSPHYQQMPLKSAANVFTAIASPTGEGCLMIQQDAFIYWVHLSAGKSLEYMKKMANNGIYLLAIDGNITVDEVALAPRDALGDFTAGRMKLQSDRGATALLFEVPAG